jgi:hypothetical protein
VPPGQRNVTTEDKKEANKVIDAIFRSPKKDRSPTVPKKVKVSKIASKIDTILNDSDSDSDSKNSNDSDSGSEKRSKDKKEQKSLLTDAFHKVYSSFDENDVEMRNDILKLLDALKTRGCVTEREYADIKSHLERRMHLNLYESIDSTIENMTQDDKNEDLEILRSIKDRDVGRLIALVKDYFEKEVELESVLLPARKLKDKLNALKIEIILKQIQKTRDRVSKIFTQLTSGSDKMDILNNLRSANLITDEQYEKLVIGPHTLPSISRIIQGKGMYLSRHH